VHITLPLTDPAGAFAVMLAVILAATFLAERVKLPGIAGLALVGILVGPYALDLIAENSAIEFLGSMGIMFVFFSAGAELDLARQRREPKSTPIFYAFTFGLPFALGLATGLSIFAMGMPSALILGCLFSFYALVPHALFARFGVARQRPAIAAASAVLPTDATAIGILAVVARVSQGGGDWLGWARAAGAALAWALLTVLLVPKAAELFFRKAKGDGTMEFVFVLAVAFVCAFASRLAGLEPFVGAFVAGLLLNRFIPASGIAMNRLRFAGDSLFVPFLMIYAGLLAKPGAAWGSLSAIGPLIAMTVLAVVSKWLAANGAGRVLGYGKDERRMLFGLSVNRSPAMIATAIIGFKLGLFGQPVLDGAIFLILASGLVGTLEARRSGKRLAAVRGERQGTTGRAPERVLVAISNPSSIHDLVAFAFLMRNRRSSEPVYPVAIVPESADMGLGIADAEDGLAQAVVQGVSAGVPVIPATRVSMRVSEGIMQAALEDRAEAVILGWNRAPKLSQAFFGSSIDQVVRDAPELVVVARITSPPGKVSQVSLVLPPLIERHPGFGRGMAYLDNFVSQTGSRLTIYTQKPDGPAVSTAMAAHRSRPRSQIVELESWKSVGATLAPRGQGSQVFVLFSARPGEAAWHPAVEKLPHRLGEERPDIGLLLFYLPVGAEGPETDSALRSNRASDILERAFAEGRVMRKMSETSINDAIRELLRMHFDDDRRTLGRLSTLFTGIAQRQPIELEPGVLLLHAHVEEAEEPLLFFGARPEGLPLLSLETPARLIVLLCAPVSQSPEEHLRVLGEIARLLKDGRIAERLGLGEEGRS